MIKLPAYANVQPTCKFQLLDVELNSGMMNSVNVNVVQVHQLLVVREINSLMAKLANVHVQVDIRNVQVHNGSIGQVAAAHADGVQHALISKLTMKFHADVNVTIRELLVQEIRNSLIGRASVLVKTAVHGNVQRHSHMMMLNAHAIVQVKHNVQEIKFGTLQVVHVNVPLTCKYQVGVAIQERNGIQSIASRNASTYQLATTYINMMRIHVNAFAKTQDQRNATI